MLCYIVTKSRGKVRVENRIEQMDVLRGIAVLGILIMNIKGFALVSSMYINPLATGPISQAEWLLFGVERLFVDYKFLAIFSIMFGAGIALLDQKLVQAHRGAFSYQFRRLFLLAIIGAMHAFILWYGDILLSYAVCGLVALLFVRLPVKLLLGLALLMAAVPVWYFIQGQISIQGASPDAIKSMVASFWVPSQSSIESEVAGYTGALSQQFEARLSSLKFMLLYLFPRENFWKSTSLMLLGIALFKSGFFYGLWNKTRYLTWGLSFTAAGLVITSFGLYQDVQSGFAIQTSLNSGRMYLYVGSIPMGVGYAALFYYLYPKISFFQQSGLASVGRMALSNYIMQTIICTFIFYGWGLGLYGQFGVLTLLLLVLAIWVGQYFLSSWWLSKHSQGPLERIWRVGASLSFAR